MKKVNLITQWIILLLFGTVLLQVIHTSLYVNGFPLQWDSFIHIQRIYEIRYAFIHHEIPNWLNFHSFFGLGQAMNGMYPDITLWPLVLITLPFSFSHQVVLINVIILFATFLVSAISVQRRYKISVISSVCVGIAYSLSGFAICQFSNEMQVGTGIVYIFSFPIAFMIFDIVNCKKLNKQLVLRFSICLTIIVYSHLLSVVVLAIILVSLLFYKLLSRQFSIYPYANILLGGGNIDSDLFTYYL